MLLQASAVAEDPFGSLLRLRSSMPSCRGGALPRRGCSLQLQLELSWPLTAFLPLVSPINRPGGCAVTCAHLYESRHSVAFGRV